MPKISFPNLAMFSNPYSFKKFLKPKIIRPDEYKLNSDGYRTAEFKKINWKDSVVIFGCSMVFGEGLDEEQTISYKLSKLINLPVINMGAIGTSIQFSLHNAVILKENFPTPKAVINLWTERNRSIYYSLPVPMNYGAWNTLEGSFGDLWNQDDNHSKIHAMLAQSISKQLWKDTVYYEATFFKATREVLKCPHLRGHLNSTDYARDNQHPGPLATTAVAKRLAKEILL
jgi:hypothetical protein